MRVFVLTAMVAALSLLLGCSTTPGPHNSIAIQPTDPDEPYTIAANVLNEFGYQQLATDQENGMITTEWVERVEFEKKSRHRATIFIKPLTEGRYEVKCKVERQFPMNKTNKGEWDADESGWTESQPDNTRQKQMLDRCRERFNQWIE